mmetsp:Transcript_48521/g.118724  ORF Transcript_48521/g.118724 Transcript_48521/m.118724 type:complete len:228 (+) Transcript_48521:48-731(+)
MFRILTLTSALLSLALASTPLHPTTRLFPSTCTGTVKYAIEFDYHWTPATNPSIDFPTVGPVDGPGFSPLVVAGHNKYWTMWAPGGFANRGPEQVAEGGNPMQILREMNRDRNIYDFGAAEGPVAATGKARMEVGLNGETEQTYVSAMSMIAPSPDWFVGIYNVQLCYNGNWVKEVSMGKLVGWDAGSSRDGEQFTDFIDPRKNQRVPIQPLGEDFMPFGTVKIYMV